MPSTRWARRASVTMRTCSSLRRIPSTTRPTDSCAAFHFVGGYGSASTDHSEEVWTQIDEAIQCDHGNPEFTDMLTQLVAFAEGNISLATSSALAQRMKFDSENASGTLRMRSEQIVAAHKNRLEREK